MDLCDDDTSLIDRLWETQHSLDNSTLSKFCQQISRFSTNKSTVESEIIKIIIWLVKAFKHNTDGSLHILNALGCLLKNNYDFSQVVDDLVGKQGILLIVIDNENETNKEKVAALKCLQYLIYYHENIQNHAKRTFLSKLHLNQCAKSLTRLLFKKKQKNETEETHCEVIIYSCKSLIKIYSNDSEITKSLEDIIGACKYWMFYSLKDMKLEMPQRLAPSQQTIADIETAPLLKGGKQRKLRRHAKSVQVRDTETNNDSNPFGYKAANVSIDCMKAIQSGATSESDISDSEGSKEKNICILQAKLRISVLNLLTVVIKTTEKHFMFGYWWAFLPDVNSEKSNIGGLGLMITLESTPSGRSAAFTVLLSLLSYSKLYLLQADTSKHMTMSFTPFSVALGISLENIHKLLLTQLENEKCIPVLVIILKCTAACIQATPYNKLGGNMLIPIIKIIHKFLSHKDWTIKVASLIVIGCIVSINPQIEEISFYLFNGYEKDTLAISNLNIEDENQAHLNKEQNTSSKHENNMNWLLITCLQNFGWKNEKTDVPKISILPTRLESLQVISAIAQRFFDAIIFPSLSTITDVLCSSLEDNSTDICLHAAKCVGSIGEAIQSSVFSKDDDASEKFCAFWSRLLNGSLTKLIQNENHALARAAACDALGAIGETILEKLEKKLKILMTTLLLGCSADEDALVKVSALRALAICIVYHQWREDPCFISDCVETTLRIVAESTFSVKIKAVWALANVTDALLLNANSPEIEEIDHDSFYKLLEASTKASNENDKIKMNAMRAIGNLIFLMNDSHFSNRSDVLNLTGSAIQRLEQCATHGNNMKVRWNACHALGKILKNSVLYKHLGKWQEKILESLCKIIETCRNLKVCIHAASALCSPSDRIQYGSTYIKIWTSVMGCLNSIHHTDDFAEYQHKKTLTDQLCITVSHLTCLIMTNDLIDLYNPLCFYWETVAKLLQEVIQRSEPQSLICSKLLDAAKYVTTELNTTNEKQTQSLVILQNMFIWDY